MKESSTYQAILEEGRQEGRQKGLTEGRVEEARKMLRFFGDRRLGPPDSQTAAAIERIEDLARLEDLCTRLETVTSWQDLLSPAATGRRDKRRSSP